MRPTRKLQATRPDLTTVKTHSLAPLHVGERSGDEAAPVVVQRFQVLQPATRGDGNKTRVRFPPPPSVAQSDGSRDGRGIVGGGRLPCVDVNEVRCGIAPSACPGPDAARKGWPSHEASPFRVSYGEALTRPVPDCECYRSWPRTAPPANAVVW